MAQQRRSLLRIDKASLFETFGNLKIRNFGYTLSCLQLFRKSMSSLSLFCLYFNFSYLRKSLTVTFPCFCYIIVNVYLDSTKRKTVWKKITTINLIKNAYPPFLNDKVIKKYLDHKFSSNQNQLTDTSGVYYFK